MGAQDMPAAEVAIDEVLVRAARLRAQAPELVELVLAELAFGWDNAIFRLGAEWTVRLPRRQLAAAPIEHEQRWLPHLAPVLPLPVPTPIVEGRPAAGYPWSWSVASWLPGTPAATTPPTDPGVAAAALGGFVAALHRPAPPDVPRNPFRGVPLAERSELVVERATALADVVDAGAVLVCWDVLVVTPPWAGPPVWVHGDLHPGNVLVDGGRVAAVIDFGDLTVGDPATDLAVAWMLLPAAARDTFRRAAGAAVDDATWRRARGWALALALAYLASSADNPMMAGVGRRTLAAVLAET